MPAGTYAALRFIADPWRDEPINVGVLVAGAAGAIARLDAGALVRMKAVDPLLQPDVVSDLERYLAGVLAEPVWHVHDGHLQRLAPDQPDYLPEVAEQLPHSFALRRVLRLELADGTPETLAQAAGELLQPLVTPTAPATTASGR